MPSENHFAKSVCGDWAMKKQGDEERSLQGVHVSQVLPGTG